MTPSQTEALRELLRPIDWNKVIGMKYGEVILHINNGNAKWWEVKETGRMEEDEKIKQ